MNLEQPIKGKAMCKSYTVGTYSRVNALQTNATAPVFLI